MGQYCFVRWRLSVVVVVCRRLWRCRRVGGPAAGAWAVGRRRAGRRASGRSVGRHCTAGQYSYVPLGRHFVNLKKLESGANV